MMSLHLIFVQEEVCMYISHLQSISVVYTVHFSLTVYFYILHISHLQSISIFCTFDTYSLFLYTVHFSLTVYFYILHISHLQSISIYCTFLTYSLFLYTAHFPNAYFVIFILNNEIVHYQGVSNDGLQGRLAGTHSGAIIYVIFHWYFIVYAFNEC